MSAGALTGTRGSSGRIHSGRHSGRGRRWTGASGLVRPKGSHGKGGAPRKSLWLITFSDLMTLVLALFVLIFSMSSMESVTLEGISRGLGKDTIQSRGLGRLQDNIILASRMLSSPPEAVRDTPLLRDLIFKDLKLPDPIAIGTLQDNIKVMQREDGTAIVLTDGLLFSPGSVHLPPNGRAVLQALAPLVRAYAKDVFISGHGGEEEGQGRRQAGAPGPYRLSAQRALGVVEFFLASGADPRYISFAGYGKDRPFEEANQPGGPDYTRRIEILFKMPRSTSQ